jgi:hypothetical protein
MSGSTFHRFQYLKLCDTVSQSTDTDSHGVFIKWLHCSIRPAGLQYELIKVQKYNQFFMSGRPYMEPGGKPVFWRSALFPGACAMFHPHNNVPAQIRHTFSWWTISLCSFHNALILPGLLPHPLLMPP